MERFAVLNLTISKRGIAFIKRWENLRLTAYKDTGGVYTIGWGSTGNIPPGLTITVEQAESLLRSDIFWAEHSLRKLVSVPLSQNEYDALVSFIFNIGGQQFAESTLRRMLNDLYYDKAADQLLRWHFDNGKPIKGLMNRRRDERLLFTGHYSL